jgi:2'-5' RNA ligase
MAERGLNEERQGRHRPRGREPYRPVEDDPERPRLFFAIPVPEAARQLVAQVMDQVQAAVGDGRAKIRWVRVEGLHLTLRFLGPTPVDRVSNLERAVDALAADVAPFPVTIAGAGAFPDPAHPRTLWLGLEAGTERLAWVAGELEKAVTAGGAALATKPFTPHLTIARTDGLRSGPAAAQAIRTAAEALDARFTADRIVLYRSLLGHGPARYEPLHEARLTG